MRPLGIWPFMWYFGEVGITPLRPTAFYMLTFLVFDMFRAMVWCETQSSLTGGLPLFTLALEDLRHTPPLIPNPFRLSTF